MKWLCLAACLLSTVHGHEYLANHCQDNDEISRPGSTICSFSIYGNCTWYDHVPKKWFHSNERRSTEKENLHSLPQLLTDQNNQLRPGMRSTTLGSNEENEEQQCQVITPIFENCYIDAKTDDEKVQAYGRTYNITATEHDKEVLVYQQVKKIDSAVVVRRRGTSTEIFQIEISMIMAGMAFIIICISFMITFVKRDAFKNLLASIVESLLFLPTVGQIVRTSIERITDTYWNAAAIDQMEKEIRQLLLVWQPILPGVKTDYVNHQACLSAMFKKPKILGFDLENDTNGRNRSKLNRGNNVNDITWKSWVGNNRQRHLNEYTVYPSTFLPSAGSLPADLMRHVGYRLASLNSLPASCNVSRVRLAEAGFYYDTSKTVRDASNIHEVVCYSCDLTYGRWKNGDNPLYIHRELRPDCSHMKTLPASHLRTATTSLAYNTATTPPFQSATASGSVSRNSPPSNSGPLSVDSGYGSSNASLPHQQQHHSFLQPSLGLPSSDDGYQSGRSHGSFADHPSYPTSLSSLGHLSSHHADSGFSSGVQSGIHSDGAGVSINGGDLATDCSAIAPPPLTQNTATPNVSRPGRSASPGDSPSTNRGQHNTSGPRKQEVEDRPLLVVSKALYPQFSRREERRATFSNWPLTQAFQPDDLTMQGFYYAGYADCIRCFYCGVGLKSWEEGDDVVKEHIRWRPSCGYVLNTMGRQFVERVLEQLQQTSSSNAQTGSSRDSRVNISTVNASTSTDTHLVDRVSSSSAANINRSATSNAVSQSATAPGASTAAPSRVISSLSTAPAPGSSSSSGSTSRDVLNQVEGMGFTSEAIERAVRYLQRKGQSTIGVDGLVDTLLDLQSHASDTTATNTREVLHTDGPVTAEDSVNSTHVEAELAQRLMLENERLRNRQTCRICHQARVGMIFMPCGHVLACSACGSKTRNCPTCGQFIRATANIYLS